MSAEMIHMACWMLLAAMALFLVVGGIDTFREFKVALRERRMRHGSAARKPLFRRAALPVGAAW